MGRWSQRQRTGGAAYPNAIISASRVDDFTLRVTWQRRVTVTAFPANMIESDPSETESDDLLQITQRTIDFLFPLSIAADTFMTAAYPTAIANAFIPGQTMTYS